MDGPQGVGLDAPAPLVGRGEELSSLVAALERAAAGRPGAVLLTGDAGVGKTRLLRAAVEAAQESGARVLVGHCLDLGDVGVPFLPVAEVLATLAAQAGQDDDVRAALLAHPQLARLSAAVAEVVGATPRQAGAETPAGDGAARLQLFDAVEGLLADLAARSGPVVLVLEDLHWADASTRDLVRFLLARLRGQRLLVLGSVRADDLHRRHPLRPILAELGRLPAVRRTDLGPLGTEVLVDHLARLARAQGGPAAAPTTAGLARVAARSEGNPYYAEELLAAGAARAGSTGVPGTVSDVLLARTEGLRQAAWDAVRAVAVGGPVVPDRLLRAVVPETGDGDDALETGLREAVGAAVLMAGPDRYCFRHALLHEAVLDDLLPGERTRLHARYAAVLRDAASRGVPLAPAAELARHALAAHDVAGALVASLDAADEASALLAPGEALRHVEQAIALLPGSPGSPGGPSTADGEAAAPLRLSLTRLRERVLRVPDADATAADSSFAVGAPGTAPGTELLQLSLVAAGLAGRAGELTRAADHARRAVALAADLGDAPALVSARFGASHHLLGADVDGSLTREAQEQVDAALAELPGAAAMPQTVTRAWLLARRARVAINLDDFAVAARTAAQAVPLAQQAASPAAEAEARVTLAVLADRDDDAAAAGDHLRRAVELAVRADDPLTESRARYMLGMQRWGTGDVPAAVVLFEEVVGALTPRGLTWSPYGISARWMLALARMASGDLAGSARAAAEAAAGPDAVQRSVAQAVALHADAATGRAGTAQRAADLLPWVGADPLASMVALGCRAEALAWDGDPAAAADAATAAVEVAESIDLEEALSGIWLAAVGVAALADAASAPGTAEGTRGALRERGADLSRRGRVLGRRPPGRGHGLGPEGRAWLARLDAEAARLGASDGEVAAWRAAVAGFGYGHRYELARSRWRLADALLATGAVPARQEAGELLRDVHADALAMGASPLAAAVEGLARRARLRLDGVATDGPGPLTDREAEVLALVAEGLTNRQVGERLFISDKTVSVHVSNLLAKLGASGRAEAVAVASRRGLLAP